MGELYNIKQYDMREKEIWECIKVSKSVMINLNLWDLTKFSKKLQRYLKKAKESRKYGKSVIFDYEPEVKGCCQDSYTPPNFYINQERDSNYKTRRNI